MSNSCQAVQSSHALADLLFTFPEESKIWYESFKTLVLLEVANETDLSKIHAELDELKIKHVLNHEPDMNNELTSIGILGTKEAKKYCKKFKLAKLCSGVDESLVGAPCAEGMNSSLGAPCPRSSISERSPLKREVIGEIPVGGAKSM